MGIETLIAAGVGLIGASSSSNAANNATEAQVDASNAQLALQQQIYDDQSARFDPFYQAGVSALGQYQNALARPQPSYKPFNYQSSPGYQFALDQGQSAIDGSAASSGGLFSGATLQAQTEYATGMASQDYNNQFNNYQVEYANQQNEYNNYMNRLGGLANSGQGAAGMQATAGSNYAAGASNALGNIGNAQSAGAIAQGNAINSGMSNALSTYGYMTAMPSSSGMTIGAPGSLWGSGMF